MTMTLTSKRAVLRGLSCLWLVLAVALWGCETFQDPITNKSSRVLTSTQEEIRLGQQVATDVQKQYSVSKDAKKIAHVKAIGRRIAAVNDRVGMTYHFGVLDDKMINAFAAPGGHVWVTTGLMGFCKNDDELAGVIGHEVGHIAARHSVRQMEAAMGANLFAEIVIRSVNVESGLAKDGINQGLGLATHLGRMKFSRDDEYEADQLGLRYAKRAGYNPQGLVNFLSRLGKTHKENPNALGNLFRTHPYSVDRVRHSERLLRSGSF